MSDFWEKNKGSIKSGLLTAGKYGYQGTKYVAKTGYQVGKNQYQANKKHRKNGGGKGKGKGANEDEEEEFEKGEPTPINRLNDPSSFPAPPLRQGQKQYAGNGQYISADDAPILNTPNQQMNQMGNQYQNQQQGYFNQQYSNPGTPGTPGTPQQYPIQQQQQQQGFQQQQMQQQPMQQQQMQQQSMQQQPLQQQPMQQQQMQQQQMQQQQMQQQLIQQQPMQQQPIQQQPMQQQPMQQQPMQQQPMQQQPMQQQPMQQQQFVQQEPNIQNNQSQMQQQGFMQELAQQLPTQPGSQESFGQQPIQQQGLQQQQRQQQQRQQPAIPGRPQPEIPFRPAIPSRTQTNTSENTINLNSSESVSTAPSSVGPHFEVKPFNKEEYDEAKKHKAVILPEIDPSTIAPPPTHKDRSNETSTRNSPSIKSSYTHKPSNTPLPKREIPTPPGAVPPYSETVNDSNATPTTTSNEDADQEGQNQEVDEAGEAKSAILGSYHEPITSFAPPPKPHRNIETNRNNSYSRTSSVGTNVNLATRGNQPPPVLPKRETNTSLQSTASVATPIQLTDETETGQNNDISREGENNHPIIGSYTDHTVSFQPPPKPFRRPGEGPEDRNLSNKSTSSSFSSQFTPTLPTRRHTTDYPPQVNNKQVTVENQNDVKPQPVNPTPAQPSSKPISEFLPPPKPFRSRTEDLSNRSNNYSQDNDSYVARGEPRDEFVDCDDEMPPQLPPHPDVSNTATSNESKHELRDRDYPSSQSLVSSIPSTTGNNDFLQDLSASISTLSLQGNKKNKTAPPPVVKPKPKSLSHISLDHRSNSTSSIDISKKGKKPPPVVKPKPKNIGNILNTSDSSSSISIMKSRMETPAKAPGMLPPQHPSRGSSRTSIPIHRKKPPVSPPHGDIQIPTNRRNKMPLPREIEDNSNSHGDDVNPFSIYKKDAVPSSSDRIHDNN